MTSSPPSASGAAKAGWRNACVVDTDVLSYLFRYDTRADPYRPLLSDRVVLVSFMTVAELERWALRRKWGRARRDEMAAFVNQFTTILVDRALCRTWATVTERADRNGRPIQTADAWIAATAVTYRLPLVTNNRSDFLGVDGLRLLPDAPT